MYIHIPFATTEAIKATHSLYLRGTWSKNGVWPEPHTELRCLVRSTEPRPLPPAAPALCLSSGVCRPATSLFLRPTAVTLAGLSAPRSWSAV